MTRKWVSCMQEKLLQSLELRRQLQKVSVTEEERRQLEEELKTLRSKDQQLKGRISQLEAMLHKVSKETKSTSSLRMIINHTLRSNLSNVYVGLFPAV